MKAKPYARSSLPTSSRGHDRSALTSPNQRERVDRADRGLIGELRYLTGHLGVPFTLLHRNELPPDMAAFVGDRTACVIAERKREYTFLLGNDDLADCAGDVKRFIALLTTRAASSRPDHLTATHFPLAYMSSSSDTFDPAIISACSRTSWVAAGSWSGG